RADVDGARRLVEDEDARVGEERPREGDELALAEREPEAALAELRVVAVLELLDELLGADCTRGRGNLLARCVGPAEGEIVRDGAGEEEALLRDDAELPAKRFLADAAEIDAVD